MTNSEGQLRRRFLIGAAAVALLVVGVLIGALVTDDGGGGDDEVSVEDDASTTTTTAEATTTTVATGPVEGATPDGQELIDLIEQGRSAVYTARYETQDPTSQLGTLQVDVWRDGDQVRQDAVVTVEDRTVESSAFVNGDDVVACQRGTGAPDWVCRPVPPDQAPNVDARIREAVEELAGTTTAAPGTTIAGRPVRCYSIIDHDGTQIELCVTEQGVPARFVAGESRVELLRYTDGVPDGIFEPPA